MRTSSKIVTPIALLASTLMLAGCGSSGDPAVEAQIQRAEQAAQRAEAAQAKAETAAKKAIIFSSHQSSADVPIDNPLPPAPPSGPEQAVNQGNGLTNNPDQNANG